MYPLIRRYLRRVDVFYLLLCAACSALSVVVLVSIGQTQLGSNNKASVQLIASLLGLMLAVVFSTADYHALARAWPLHAVVAWGLVLPTLFLRNVNTGLVTIGYDAGGTSNYSWYRVGGMTFQPAELAKISFILTLALHLSNVRGQVNKPKNLLLLLLHIGLPAAAIHVQGDDGTALVFRIRESACSGDCHKCSGCGAAKETVTFTAKNPIGARRGELVKVESETAPVLKAAAVLYVVPLVLFFSGYYLGFRLGGFGALVGGLGFALGILLVLVYDRKVARKANIDYTITAFARKI